MNQAHNKAIEQAVEARPLTDGRQDFDFLMGRHAIRNRRLLERLKGCQAWEEFDAVNTARPLLRGVGNEDEFVTEHAGGFTGMSFRFFNIATGQWSIYWADSRRGTLEPPVVGGFSGNVGIFSGADTLGGKEILVRFIWSQVDTAHPRWEQAFSDDGGLSWETNWVMDFSRIA